MRTANQDTRSCCLVEIKLPFESWDNVHKQIWITEPWENPSSGTENNSLGREELQFGWSKATPRELSPKEKSRQISKFWGEGIARRAADAKAMKEKDIESFVGIKANAPSGWNRERRRGGHSDVRWGVRLAALCELFGPW